MTLHGFVDESTRGDRYQLALTTAHPSQVKQLRRHMSRLLLPGQREVHMQKEKNPRRRQILDRLPTGVAVTLFHATVTGRGQEHARSACLARLVHDAVASGLERLVLDSRTPRDQADARTIRRALSSEHPEHRLSWEHLDSSQDPLIWISDVVGWAHGAGRDWRRRTERLVTAVVDCD